MTRNQNFNSPLSRLEQEATRQRDKKFNNNRLSLISSVSNDSVSTTGRLLDKLKLADNEWDDDFDKTNDNSININDTDTSFGSIITLNSDNSIKINTSSNSDLSPNSSYNILPASKFKYLKSVLGDTKKKNSQKSAVNKALEMGKKINTVENNVSHVIHRSSVKSIHLDGLLRDADSSISSYDSQSDIDLNEDYEINNNNNNKEKEENENQEEGEDYDKYEPLKETTSNITYNHSNPIDINSSSNDTELSFIPNTPTKMAFNATPVNSPETFIQVTPQYSIDRTPKINLHSHHNHTHSSLSNTSFRADSISESFIGKNNNIINNNNNNINNNDSNNNNGYNDYDEKEIDDNGIFNFQKNIKNDSNSTVYNSKISNNVPSNFQPSHHHAQSATNKADIGCVDSELVKNINDTLIRSASVPTKRKPSTNKPIIAPKSPLPLPPVALEKSDTNSFNHSNNIPKPSYSTNPALYNTGNQHNYTNQHQQQQQQFLQYLPQQSHAAAQQYHTLPPQQQHQQQQHNQSIPIHSQYYYNNQKNVYSKRTIASPSSKQLNFVSPQNYQNRNFNPLYGPHQQVSNRIINKQKAIQQTQQLLYPQHLNNSPHTNINNNNPYYNNTQRFGSYSQQNSPNVGNYNLTPNNNSRTNNHLIPLNNDNEYDGAGYPLTPPSHIKKNNKFQNVDLSYIMPR